MRIKALRKRLLVDFSVILLAVILAVTLEVTGVIHQLLELTKGWALVEAFVSGLLFTSAFTTPFSMAVFFELGADQVPILPTALLGGIGAVCGDYLLFRFVRDRFGEDLLAVFKRVGWGRLKGFFELRLFRFVTFIVAGLIIASPLPDELAVTLLGFSKVKSFPFLLVSFTFNFLGILAILVLGRSS
jgi:hypothetical protein